MHIKKRTNDRREKKKSTNTDYKANAHTTLMHMLICELLFCVCVSVYVLDSYT